jgi:hypothetical protein
MLMEFLRTGMELSPLPNMLISRTRSYYWDSDSVLEEDGHDDWLTGLDMSSANHSDAGPTLRTA